MLGAESRELLSVSSQSKTHQHQYTVIHKIKASRLLLCHLKSEVVDVLVLVNAQRSSTETQQRF